MRALHLFAGCGGGILASLINEHQIIGANEIDKFCCDRLRQRQDEGNLPQFPVWEMDVREFNARVAPVYTGVVDILCAGFPCQPFSVSGRQLRADDPRNMWPATAEAIRIIRPRYVMLENVPGLLANRKILVGLLGIVRGLFDPVRRRMETVLGLPSYVGRVFGDLAEIGYDARWTVLSAGDLGAPHERKRLWILANNNGQRELQQKGREQNKRGRVGNGGEIRDSHCSCESIPWACSLACENARLSRSGIRRISHGVAHRNDRLKALGNGQVSIVAATAERLLMRDIETLRIQNHKGA